MDHDPHASLSLSLSTWSLGSRDTSLLNETHLHVHTHPRTTRQNRLLCVCMPVQGNSTKTPSLLTLISPKKKNRIYCVCVCTLPFWLLFRSLLRIGQQGQSMEGFSVGLFYVEWFLAAICRRRRYCWLLLVAFILLLYK